jgi:hypothetical protein
MTSSGGSKKRIFSIVYVCNLLVYKLQAKKKTCQVNFYLGHSLTQGQLRGHKKGQLDCEKLIRDAHIHNKFVNTFENQARRYLN